MSVLKGMKVLIVLVILLVATNCNGYAEFCVTGTAYTLANLANPYGCDPLINYEHFYQNTPAVLVITAGTLSYKDLSLLDVGDVIITSLGDATVTFIGTSTISGPTFISKEYPSDCVDVRGIAVNPTNEYAYLGFVDIDLFNSYTPGNLTDYTSRIETTPSNVYHGADEPNDYSEFMTCDICTATNILHATRLNKDRYFNYGDCLALQLTTPSYFDCYQNGFTYDIPSCSSVLIGTDIGVVEVGGIIWAATTP